MGGKHNLTILREQIISKVRGDREIHRKILQHHPSALGTGLPVTDRIRERIRESFLTDTLRSSACTFSTTWIGGLIHTRVWGTPV